MHAALIAIGGNLGDVSASIAGAFNRLAVWPCCHDAVLSRVFATVPMGQQAGATFLNATIRLETSLEPLGLLDALQNIEVELGRVRTMHWGPRVIDLDLIGFGDRVVDDQRLTLPHPGLIYRRFVLDPLLDIAPDWVHPQLDRTVRELRQRLMIRPLPVQMQGAIRPSAALQQRFHGEIAFHEANTSASARLDLQVAIGVSPATRPHATEWIAIGDTGSSVHDREELLEQLLRAALDDPAPCQ